MEYSTPDIYLAWQKGLTMFLPTLLHIGTVDIPLTSTLYYQLLHLKIAIQLLSVPICLIYNIQMICYKRRIIQVNRRNCLLTLTQERTGTPLEKENYVLSNICFLMPVTGEISFFSDIIFVFV
jgi:hypothetical protein